MQFGAQRDPRRRLMSLAGVGLLHVAVIWGLVHGLARHAVEPLPAPIETKIIDDVTPPDVEPLPPPPPDFEIPPPAFVPPPDIVISRPAEPTRAIQTVSNTVPPPAPAPVVRAPVTVAPVVRARNCRDPDYPAISQRLGETGSVVVELLVGADGRVTDSRVRESSGFERLDKAALAGLSRCRFTPGTVDGQAQAAWAQMRYTFRVPG